MATLGRSRAPAAAPPGVGETGRRHEFWTMKHVMRQNKAFELECSCTQKLMHQVAGRHQSLNRLVVLDGAGFRWEGLGNSAPRWMGLLRWGHATGRAAFLRISEPCGGSSKTAARDKSTLSDRTCHMDPGTYFTGWGGVDWQWRGRREKAMRRRLQRTGVSETVIRYECHWPHQRANGCTMPDLVFANGSRIRLPEPEGVLAFFREARDPWITLRLQQQNSLEYSYSKPEAMRKVLPLARCPHPRGRDFRSRELALKCETYAYMQPRPKLMTALLPSLRRLEPFDAIVGVHLRTGYADWQFRNADSFFEQRVGPPLARLTPAQHWQQLETYLQECKTSIEGPCFNWEAPHFGRKPMTIDARRCRVSAGTSTFELKSSDAPDGTLAALLMCAARLGEGLLTSVQANEEHAAGRSRRAATAASDTEKKAGWGLLVLSDSPAFPSLAATLPPLAGRVTISEGTGTLGHSSFTKSCSAQGGCVYGVDPGGAWTRSCVDFYLAGVADGFVKALFTSFIWATMRRNLLCCRPGSFVQWNAWYNLSRSHRDLPMRDRQFMHILALTHEPNQQWEG